MSDDLLDDRPDDVTDIYELQCEVCGHLYTREYNRKTGLFNRIPFCDVCSESNRYRIVNHISLT